MRQWLRRKFAEAGDFPVEDWFGPGWEPLRFQSLAYGWVWQDLWVGVFVRPKIRYSDGHVRVRLVRSLDVYIVVLPTVVVRLTWA